MLICMHHTTTRRRRAARAAFALPLLLTLAACDTPFSNRADTQADGAVFTSIANPDAPEAAPSGTTERTPEKTDDTADATTSERPAPKPSSSRPRECASLPKDPHSMYPDGSAPGRMPAVSNGDYNFWIDDIDNAYDRCAPISYIVFRGQLGDANGVAGTAGSITDGIAIYVDGKPDGEMRIFGRIDDVYLQDDETLRLRFSERTGATAEGFTGNYEVTLAPSGGGVEVVDGDEGAFYNRWGESTSAYMLGTYD